MHRIGENVYKKTVVSSLPTRTPFSFTLSPPLHNTKKHKMDCGIFNAFFRKRHTHGRTHTKDEVQHTAPQVSDIESERQENSQGYGESGRKYHNRPDVAYILPDDERENDRVHLQHWLMKETFGGNFSAPVAEMLDKGIIVQDSGCGPGTWTLEMATDFPRSTFIGTDVSARFPEAIKPSNCQFQVHNLLNQGVLPENHFGYIHQRFLILAILEKDWESVIKEHVRTLAPGGWLECMELPVYRAHNSGPKYEVLSSAFNAVCKIKGLDAKIPDHLEELFKRAGLVNIGIREADGPMNEETQYGRAAWEDFREALTALKPFVVKANPELQDDEKFQQLMQDCLKEFIELGTAQIFYRIWGQKPLES
ncbi:S-adenosyl-L-methionine-dependent methyltransferase [Dichotomocladium elegans]|nr:S-adenosyl-L-methionine-dependent methyltransferase [Dichotomocladium elegans]